MKCSTMEHRKPTREINDHITQDRYCTNRHANDDVMVSYKNKYKIDHFIVGPEKSVDMNTSAELTQPMHDEFKNVYMHCVF